MNPSCEVVAPVFEQYRQTLTRFIKSRVGDPVDTEELMSQVLLKIYNHCEKLEHVKNPEAWLITIAKNTISDYQKFQKRQLIAEHDKEVSEEELNTLYLDLEKCLPSLIEKLPEKYAAPLVAYELEGISQKELAKRYGMSESGLKSRVQRGRKMMKGLFIEYCGHLVQQEGCRPCQPNC